MTEQAGPGGINRAWRIIPVDQDKIPFKGTHGADDASNDPAQIGRWAIKYPGCNWAVVLGPSGLVALDAEGLVKHGTDGQAELERLQRELGFDLDGAPTEETPSGGREYLFADPGDLPNLTDAQLGGAGLELRTGNRYVLLPGSYARGKGDNGDYHGPYVAVNSWETDAPPLPEALHAYLLKIARPKPRPERPSTPKPANGEILGGAYWLQRYCNQTAPGSRHDDGLKLALQLRACGLSRPDAEPFMLQFAEYCEALGPCQEPAAQHMLRILTDVYDKTDFDMTPATPGGPLPKEPEYMRDRPPPDTEPPGVEPMTPGDTNTGYTPGPKAPTPKRPIWEAHMMTHDDLLAATFPEDDWLIDGLVVCGGLTALGGIKKLGKSLWCLQAAWAVAQGGYVLGRKCTRGKVVYVCLEDGFKRIQKRLKQQGAPQGLDVKYITRFQALDAGGIRELRALLTQEAPQLLIIDTIAAAKTGRTDENDAGAMGDIGNALRIMAQDFKCAIIAVLHHGKVTGGDPGFDIRGSSAISGAADVNLGLYRSDQTYTLKGEGRDVDAIELRIALDIPTLTWNLVGDARRIARDEANEEVLEVVQALGEADARAVARETGKTRQRIQTVLKRLVREGKLTSTVKKTGSTSRIVYCLKVCV